MPSSTCQHHIEPAWLTRIIDHNHEQHRRALDLAWLAGMVDGEACIRIARRAPSKSSACGNPIFSVEITLGQNCVDTLDYIRALMERHLGIVCGKLNVVGRVAPEKAPTQTLTLRSAMAVKLLRAVRPYLRRKDLEADLAVRLGLHIQRVYAKRRASGQGLKVPLSAREIRFREACYRRLSALKLRGPGCAYEGARQCARAS